MPPKPIPKFDDHWSDIVSLLDRVFDYELDKLSTQSHTSLPPISWASQMQAFCACYEIVTSLDHHPSDKSLPDLQNPVLAALYRPSTAYSTRTYKCLLLNEKLELRFTEKARMFSKHLQIPELGILQLVQAFRAYTAALRTTESRLLHYDKRFVRSWQEKSIPGSGTQSIMSVCEAALRSFRVEVVEGIDLEAACRFGCEMTDLEKDEAEKMFEELGITLDHRWRDILRGAEGAT